MTLEYIANNPKMVGKHIKVSECGKQNHLRLQMIAVTTVKYTNVARQIHLRLLMLPFNTINSINVVRNNNYITKCGREIIYVSKLYPPPHLHLQIWPAISFTSLNVDSRAAKSPILERQNFYIFKYG
jgi:hypothetical protein